MDITEERFEAVEFDEVLLIGKKTEVLQGRTATAFVKEFRSDGSNEHLQKLDNRVSPKGDIIIYMGEYDSQAKSFTEIPGIFAKPGCEVPAGYDYRVIPRCMMGIYTVSGKTRSLTRGAHNKLVKLMEQNGYAPDYSLGFSMEYYSYEKYEKKNDVYSFSYYLPCKKV